METDLHLFSRYHHHGDSEAFRSLVQAHAGMVFAVARRITLNAALAEEVTQDTFLALARRGSPIRESVAAWLHHVARQKARNALRGEQRRQRREQEAAVETLHARHEASWAEVEPVVDEALDELPEKLRVLLIEHFLERRSQEEIARRMGLSQSTVSRQIEAALQLLRTGLKQKGVMCGASLGAVLYSNTAQAAPASLTASLGKIAMTGIRSAAGPTATSSFLITMTTTTKAILATTTLAAVSLPFLLPRDAPSARAIVTAQTAARPAASSPSPRPRTTGQQGPASIAAQRAARDQEIQDEKKLILAEFVRMGGLISQIGEQAIERDIATIIESNFGNDHEAFNRRLAEEGKTLDQFKTERTELMAVSAMKAKITQGITGPEAKKRAIDEWLTELRLAAVQGESKPAARADETD